MKTSEIMRAAKDNLSNPEYWTKGWFATDFNGNCVSWDSTAACKWCISGALRLAAGDRYENYQAGKEDVSKDARLLFIDANKLPLDIPTFNDARETTHEDVMKAFDVAISAAEREGL